MAETRWRLVVHGGAGSMRRGLLDPEQERRARAGLEARSGRWLGYSREARSCARRRGSRRAGIGGRSRIQCRSWERAHRQRMHRARRRDHGRAYACRWRGCRDSGPRARQSALRAICSIMVRMCSSAATTQTNSRASTASNRWAMIGSRSRGGAISSTRCCACGRIRRRGEIWHGRCRSGGRRWTCRGRDIDRRADGEALGPGRGFAADRRRHLRRRPRRCRLGDRHWGGFHPRRRRAPARRTRADRWPIAAGGARRCSRRCRGRLAVKAV